MSPLPNIPSPRTAGIGTVTFCVLILITSACSNIAEAPLDLSALNKAPVQVSQVTGLMMAAKQGDVAAIRLSLQNGDRLNAHTAEDNAFSLAVKAGQLSLAEFLLKIGADYQHGFTASDASALLMAAKSGHNGLVKRLILKGAEVNERSLTGKSALTEATLNHHLTTMKILINAGAAVDFVFQGKSLLMYTVLDNNPLLAQVLIAAGADVNYRSVEGDTALKMARRAGYYDLDLMLVQAGARL